MEGLQIDLTAIVAIWMTGVLLLIPVAGLTARFALKPLLETFLHLREARVASQSTAELELRFATLEERIERLTDAMERWAAAQASSREPAAA